MRPREFKEGNDHIPDEFQETERILPEDPLQRLVFVSPVDKLRSPSLKDRIGAMMSLAGQEQIDPDIIPTIRDAIFPQKDPFRRHRWRGDVLEQTQPEIVRYTPEGIRITLENEEQANFADDLVARDIGTLTEAAIDFAHKVGTDDAVSLLQEVYTVWIDKQTRMYNPYTELSYKLTGQSLQALHALGAPAPNKLLELAQDHSYNIDYIRGKESDIEHPYDMHNYTKRTDAIQDLRFFVENDPQALELLATIAATDEFEPRLAAIWALGQARDSRALPILQGLMANIPEPITLWTASGKTYQVDETIAYGEALEEACYRITSEIS